MATYLKTAYFNQLYKRLCKIHRSEDAVTIASQSELQLEAINFSGIALNTWDSIISQAEYEGKIAPLINAAIAFENGDEELEGILASVNNGEAIEKAIIIKKDRHLMAEGRIVNILFINHYNDKTRCANLARFFAPLIYEKEVSILDMQNEKLFGNIQEAREEMFRKSQIIMPVISPDFFSPDDDFMQFVRAAIDTDKKLVPLLMVKCPYGRVKVLKDYVALPPREKFINEYTNEELGYNDVATGIIPLIEACNRVIKLN